MANPFDEEGFLDFRNPDVSIPQLKNAKSRLLSDFSVSIDSLFAKELERRAGINLRQLAERVLTLFEPTGFKRNLQDQTQYVSAPCIHELWYVIEVENPNGPKESVLDFNSSLNLSVIRTADDIIAEERGEPVDPVPRKALFEIYYQGGSAYGITGSVKDGEDPVGWVDFLIGYPCSMRKLYYAGETSASLVSMATFYETEGSEVKINPDIIEGANPRPFLFIRRFLYPSETLPVPGEFLASIIEFDKKPWLEQLTEKVVFSGTFPETYYYTSGIVQAVGVGTLDIYIRGLLYRVKVSDFAEYKVGDRVAVMKTTGEGQNWDWKDLDFPGGSEPIQDSSYRVIPITFYGKT